MIYTTDIKNTIFVIQGLWLVPPQRHTAALVITSYDVLVCWQIGIDG